MIVYLEFVLAYFCFHFFSLIFNCFLGATTMCTELTGYGGGQERQTEIHRVKILSFNTWNEKCRPFSSITLLKG